MDTDRLAVRTIAPRPARDSRAEERDPAHRASDADDTGRYRRACRDAETARLLLAELGRWHGPMA